MRQLVFVMCLALLSGSHVLAQEPGDAIVIVTVHWPGHDLAGAQVRVFKDPQRRELVGAFPATDKSGRVIMTFAPGTYYLTVIADLNADTKLGPGDGLGFYGVADPNTDQPQPLEVKEGALTLTIPVSLMMNEEGRLAPTGVKLPGATETPPHFTVRGTLTGREEQGLAFVYLVPKQGPCQVAVPDTEGRFALVCPAGEYYFFAMQDTDGNERMTHGDLMAVYGYDPAQGRAYPSVQITADLTEVSLALQWRLDPTALLRAVEGEAEGPQTAPETFPVVLYGRVQWPAGVNPPEPLPALTVRAATDARFAQVVGSVSCTEGRFALCLPQGLYFLSVQTDADGDGKPGAGDCLGFFGVTDLNKSRGPQPLMLGAGELREADLSLSLRLNEQLQPTPLQ